MERFGGEGVKTVVLFLERRPTDDLVLPTISAWLAKTNPLNDADLKEFVTLQASLADSKQSWSVDIDSVDKTTFDLSVKNPNKNDEVVLRDPQAILDEIAALDKSWCGSTGSDSELTWWIIT